MMTASLPAARPRWTAAVLGLLVALWIAAPAAAAPDYPALTGRVVDAANLLTTQARADLDAKLAAHEQQSGNQVVVATVPSLDGESIEEYGVGLGRHWGIGREGEDDGVLLIVAPNEREVRIEVGYGLEGALTDALSSQIIQNEILPRFRAGDMSGGIVAGADAVLATLGGTYEAQPWPATGGAAPRQPTLPVPDWIIPLLFFGVWFLIVFIVRRRGLGRRLGPWMGVPGIGGFGAGGSSRGRGGFSGGGFRGGGGSFGGGGATGRW